MDFRVVQIDVEKVRGQLAAELGRAVTDIEVIVWLRRCGFVQHNSRWVADVSSAQTRATEERLGVSHHQVTFC